MSNTQLTDGSPVPEDRSHAEIEPGTGMQKGYVVLSPEERAKGFVKRVRRTYVHRKCGVATTMGIALAETYARDPNFYSGTYCVGCSTHLPLAQFEWEDGEPMDPLMQPAWAQEKTGLMVRLRREEIARLKEKLAKLEAEEADCSSGTTTGPTS